MTDERYEEEKAEAALEIVEARAESRSAASALVLREKEAELITMRHDHERLIEAREAARKAVSEFRQKKWAEETERRKACAAMPPATVEDGTPL